MVATSDPENCKTAATQLKKKHPGRFGIRLHTAKPQAVTSSMLCWKTTAPLAFLQLVQAEVQCFFQQLFTRDAQLSNTNILDNVFKTAITREALSYFYRWWSRISWIQARYRATKEQSTDQYLTLICCIKSDASTSIILIGWSTCSQVTFFTWHYKDWLL